MNKNNMLQKMSLLLVFLLFQNVAFSNSTSVEAISELGVAATPSECADGFYSLDLIITYEEGNDPFFRLNIGGVDFGNFFYENFPSGSTLTIEDLVADGDGTVTVTITDFGDVEVPCVGTDTYLEPSCCTPSSTCNLADIDLQGCSAPAPFTDANEVFSDLESCGAAVTLTSADAGDLDFCMDGNGVDFVRTYRLFFDGVEVDTCVQTIVVADTTAPMLICPQDLTLACTDGLDPASTGMAMATDNCTDPTDIDISFSDVSTQEVSGCAAFTYSVFRTWMATDACGNTATCVQTIEVADTEPPAIVCLPSQTLTCFETLPTPFTTAAEFVAAGGFVSDNCTTNLEDFTIFATSETNGGNNCPGNEGIFTRIYYLQDACMNTAICAQIFTYEESTVDPVITSILPTCYKYCASLNNPMAEDISFETDCSFGATVSIDGPTVIGAANCPGSIYRYEYSVTDDCGRISAPVTRDFIIGNDGPTINCPPFNLILECGDLNNQEYIDTHLGIASVNTACASGFTLNYFPQNFNTLTCGNSTVVTFVATDDCGRTASCTTTITVQDSEAPVFTNIPADGFNEFECADNLNFWFQEWIDYMENGLAAEDACDDNVTIQALNTPLNSDCDNGDAETVVTFAATDNCGNQSFHTGTFTVTSMPLSFALEGVVTTPVGEAVSDVSITVQSNNAFTNTIVTTDDGQYYFDNLLENQNYTVTPARNDDPLNGVSSYDLVLISKHILQVETLDSPYKMIAADVNNSGSITTMDLVELKKVILHVQDEFQNNTSWRFTPADYVFPQPGNPFATIFPEEIYINGLQPAEQHDLIAIKTGDVNGSAVANDLTSGEDRDFKGQLFFDIADQEVTAGETFDVVFTAQDFHNIAGYQFTINFDQSILDYNDVAISDMPGMSENNFGLNHLKKGLITTSWHHQREVSRADEEELFRLQFTAATGGKISDWISISSQKTAAEAYRTQNTEMDLLDVQLRFSNNGFTSKEFKLLPNSPNPFMNNTKIAFLMPRDEKATISIYDASWKLVKSIEEECTKGYNEIVVDRSDLPNAGLFFYQVVSPVGHDVSRMILLE